MNNEFPKVLILGETFHRYSGGGITLSNLFKDFPKENIAVAVNSLIINKSSNEICHNYFCLGKENYKPVFPFNLLFRMPPSGKYNVIVSIKKSKKKNFVKALFKFILHKTGFEHNFFRYYLTGEFLSWINEFSPDIIYTQLGEYSKMNFVKEVYSTINKPIVLHIMDDWLTTAPKCLFGFYWKKKFDRSFKDFLSITSIALSISAGMSVEYKRRYNKNFVSFHNPVDLDFWNKSFKTDYSINPQAIKLMYSGKMGSLGTSTAIYDIANAIEYINKKGKYYIEFQIQSYSISSKNIKKLNKYKCVKINPAVEYAELPYKYSSIDFLVIPMDFNKKGMEYLKYSMLTKASEFMISGTPIILYAPVCMAMVRHAEKFGWAKVISQKEQDIIVDELICLIESQDNRMKLGEYARSFCKTNYDAKQIREQFRKCLLSVS